MSSQFFAVHCDIQQRLVMPQFQHAYYLPGELGLGLEGRRLHSQCDDELGNRRFVLWSGCMLTIHEEGVSVILAWFERVTGGLIGVHCECIAGLACTFVCFLYAL